MVDLETKKVPRMTGFLTNWQRYVDDTLCFVKKGKTQNVLNILNKHHKYIGFTFEVEENGKIPFLDVLLTKEENNKIATRVYRKNTCSNLEFWKFGKSRQKDEGK